ncbi:hypothetical protein ACHAWF_000937 [Thalassiosira exigua]
MCTPPRCALYSLTGLLFLLFVYSLLTFQPSFVKGVEDLDRAKESALGCAILFAALFALSLAGIAWKRRADGRGGEEDEWEEGAGGRDGRGRYRRLNANLNYQLSALLA